MSDKQDELIVQETIKNFLDQFGGNDIYSSIVLEELFKILYESRKSLSIPRSQRQKGN
jgi:hypothetical protein